MTEEPNFVLIPDEAPPAPARTSGMLARLRTMATTAVVAAASALATLRSALGHAKPPAVAQAKSAHAKPRVVATQAAAPVRQYAGPANPGTPVPQAGFLGFGGNGQP